MSIESKNHRPDSIQRTTVSQGTRRDARPEYDVDLDTYSEQRERLIVEKKRLEAELTKYSKSAIAAEQHRVREQNRDRPHFVSLNAWLQRKREMESHRQKLVSAKSEVEAELLRLKPLVRAEKQRGVAAAESSKSSMRQSGAQIEDFNPLRPDGTLCWDGVAAQLLVEMRAIRELLEDLRGRERA